MSTDPLPDVLDPTDRRRVGLAAGVVARPPADPPDSFALHAALELGARYDLLAATPAGALDVARARIDELVAAYGALATVDPPAHLPPAEVAPDLLVRAIAAGDVAGADAAATALVESRAPSSVAAATAALVLPLLSAAGHGVIAVDRLRRVGADDPVGAAGLRLLAREAARHPDHAITWHRHHPQRRPSAAGPTLERALAAPPAPGPRGNGFVQPMVHQVESAGLPDDLLADALAATDRHEAARTLLRVAARSMLQDDPAAAPYGLTHGLTLPLGALGLAGSVGEPGDAVAVAATYVLAFRATQGRVELEPTWTPPRSAGLVHDAWHAEPERRAEIATELVAMAAGHHDAHLVKYVEACRRAALLDPDGAHLYLAAASHLTLLWLAAGTELDWPHVGPAAGSERGGAAT